MQSCPSVTIKQQRKTRKGWVGYKVKQIHLRNDIPCGLQYCNQHNNPFTSFRSESTDQQTILFFMDTDTIIQQTDIIYNCQELRNICFLQSQVEKLKKKSIVKYNAFKNHLESQAVGEATQKQQMQKQNNNRNYWIYADIYSKPISQAIALKSDIIQINNQEQKQWMSLEGCAQWYQSHIQQLKLQMKVVIITTSQKHIKRGKLNSGIQIKSLVQFLKQKSSNLLDFIGFKQFQTGMEQQAIFQQHIVDKEAKKKIKEGKLFEGKYMGEKSYFKIGKTMHKIKLQNNRAMFGDVVAIQISPFQFWERKTTKFQLEDTQNLLDVKLEDIQQNIQEQSVKNLIVILQKNTNVLPKGKVKSILRRNNKDYCGSVITQKIIRQSEQGWTMYQFKPADDRFPLFYIRTYNVSSIKGKRIQVSFDSWPSRSLNPLCHFVKIIGDIGNSKTEGDVILLQHNVQIKQFSRKAYECLPKDGVNFKITKQQQASRLDIRHLDVVSIDPPSCKDIDDALHCVRLPNGNFQVGVHIADVSYYVRPDTALDLEARNRCTTVYLVDRRTDMLPKLLTQNLCSLRANVDRLAFSTIWQMNQNAKIISVKYTKSIINSKRAFTYMEAQQLMESDSKTNIAESIRNLNKLAKKLKQQRLNDGALTLASTQVKITFEQQTHNPTDVQLYHMIEANYLIQQFMLLANIAVAQKIYSRFPSLSILRRHTPPKTGQLQILKEVLSMYNFQLKYETSKALAESLNKIQKKGDSFFNRLIRILTTRCMNQATYFCSADYDPQQFFHYGLAAPFYTHFTSPIRRYADVLVHRLLAAAIDLQPLPNFMINKLKMTKICQKMNTRNRMARYASRASSDYHTYQFFKQKQGQKQKGIITAISQNIITVMLVQFGLQCKYELSETDTKQTIQKNKGQGIFNKCYIKQKQRKLFEYVQVGLKVQMHGFHKKITIDVL